MTTIGKRENKKVRLEDREREKSGFKSAGLSSDQR